MTADNTKPALIWFRNDLRVTDNRAFLSASEGGRPVICLFVLDDLGPLRPMGAAQRWWLHHSLEALTSSLETLKTRLILRRGHAEDIIPAILDETGAEAVYWNRRYDPAGISVDSKLKAGLRAHGRQVETFEGQLLHEPSRTKTGSGTPFKVFTPFWRSFLLEPEPRQPFPAPVKLSDGSARIGSERLEDWKLLPKNPDWASGMRQEWTPGEAGAHERLDAFLAGAIQGYGEGRNLPFKLSTSKLSAHLVMGEITPFQIWHATDMKRSEHPTDTAKFLSEIGWREFAYHLLFHFPKLASANFNSRFEAFPWGDTNADHLIAWQKGKTGFPIVDAGMRELWQTGWMHNRVRMIAASFLIKHLMIDWRTGENWFWDTLVDACPANNPAGWQWVAGSGADAAPYFRIFNPFLQGEKFDPDGDYVRRYVPELKDMPAKFIHKPWTAPLSVQKEAGCLIGKHYPAPIVDHDKARARALQAYKGIQGEA